MLLLVRVRSASESFLKIIRKLYIYIHKIILKQVNLRKMCGSRSRCEHFLMPAYVYMKLFNSCEVSKNFSFLFHVLKAKYRNNFFSNIYIFQYLWVNTIMVWINWTGSSQSHCSQWSKSWNEIVLWLVLIAFDKSKNNFPHICLVFTQFPSWINFTASQHSKFFVFVYTRKKLKFSYKNYLHIYFTNCPASLNLVSYGVLIIYQFRTNKLVK